MDGSTEFVSSPLKLLHVIDKPKAKAPQDLSGAIGLGSRETLLNELLKTVKLLGRSLWKKWSGYHRRSLVETKMHCIKLLGDKLTARSFPSQVNEIHARVAVLNKFTELGRPHTQVVT